MIKSFNAASKPSGTDVTSHVDLRCVSIVLQFQCLMCALLLIRFYGQDIRASAILNGDVEPPPEAYDLYTILQDYTEKYTTDWQNKNMKGSSKVTVCVLLPHVGQTYMKPSKFYL